MTGHSHPDVHPGQEGPERLGLDGAQGGHRHPGLGQATRGLQRLDPLDRPEGRLARREPIVALGQVALLLHLQQRVVHLGGRNLILEVIHDVSRRAAAVDQGSHPLVKLPPQQLLLRLREQEDPFAFHPFDMIMRLELGLAQHGRSLCENVFICKKY